MERSIRDVRHCGFTILEQEIAFRDLANRVRTGAKPAGDDVITPAVVASATDGCSFTTGTIPPIGWPASLSCS